MTTSRSAFCHLFFGLCLCATPSFAAGDASLKDQQQRTVKALEQSTQADPSNSELWLHLGFAYRKTENLDQAIAAFQKSATLNPKATDAFYMLGLIYESKHQSAEATSAWKSYLSAETDPQKRSTAQNHLHQLGQ